MQQGATAVENNLRQRYDIRVTKSAGRAGGGLRDLHGRFTLSDISYRATGNKRFFLVCRSLSKSNLLDC